MRLIFIVMNYHLVIIIAIVTDIIIAIIIVIIIVSDKTLVCLVRYGSRIKRRAQMHTTRCINVRHSNTTVSDY